MPATRSGGSHMKRWVRNSAVAAAAFTAGVFAAASIAGSAWARTTGRLVERLESRAQVSPDSAFATYSTLEISGLPAPVIRYFEYALTPGQPLVRSSRVEQSGEFASRPGKWAPFTAVEHFSVFPPGFVWDARIRMAPLLNANVRDSYVGGEGVMHGSLGGMLSVVDQRGTVEMATSTLLRYLAEAPWTPTALLPASGVLWEAIDRSSARASITDSGITVSMDVRFGTRGEIVEINALRHRDLAGEQVLTPWRGVFGDYQRVEGMMVPGRGEVGWILDGAWLPYWRGRNTAWEFTYVR
jgi:hypothetical protein